MEAGLGLGQFVLTSLGPAEVCFSSVLLLEKCN